MEFSKKTVNENMFLKLVLSVEGVDAMETYRKLGDYRARTKWDRLLVQVRHGRPVATYRARTAIDVPHLYGT